LGSQLFNARAALAERDRLKQQLLAAKRKTFGIQKRGGSFAHKLGLKRYSPSQRQRRKASYSKQCRAALNCLDFPEFSPSSLRVKNTFTGQYSDYKISESPTKSTSSQGSPTKKIQKVLKLKDQQLPYPLQKHPGKLFLAIFYENSKF
jgi:hypothetical protein